MSELHHNPSPSTPEEPTNVISMRKHLADLGGAALLGRSKARHQSDDRIRRLSKIYEARQALEAKRPVPADETPTEEFPMIKLDPVRQDTSIQETDEWIDDQL